MGDGGATCIAMWSGPRNLSTAMMRSFGARSDTVCVDEPFYAPFLTLSGLQHPMQEDILASHETDAGRVIEDLVRPREGHRVYYQKHMTHHMIDEIARDWMGKVENAFLIRHPARVLASYEKKMETVSLEAMGFPQQLELYEYACRINEGAPVVVDSDEILRAPEHALRELCAGLGIPFEARMLSWQPGPKPEDGAWGPHWYDGVYASNGFKDAPGELPPVAPAYERIYEDALEIYAQMHEARLRLDAPQN